MICKNGTKHYVLLGAVYALIIFISDIVFEEHSILTSAFLGIIVGVLIPIVLWVCDAYDTHCAHEFRKEEMKTQKIICEGWAQIDEHDGWLFFTEEYLKFHPYKASDKCFEMSKESITRVSASSAFLTVSFAGGESLKLHVNKPFLWKKMISRSIKTN